MADELAKLVTEEEMQKAIAKANAEGIKRSSWAYNARMTLRYIGIGLAVQVIGYGLGDLPVASLLQGDFPLSLLAHVLGWPVFVLLLVLEQGFWALVYLVGFALLVVAGFYVKDVLWPSIRDSIRRPKTKEERVTVAGVPMRVRTHR